MSVVFVNRKQWLKVPGTNVTLQKQDTVHISVYGIHTDPKFYPDPFKFDPERFSKEGKATRSP
jgi:cytochrome P450